MTFNCKTHGDFVGKSKECPLCTPHDFVSYGKQGNKELKKLGVGNDNNDNTTSKHEHIYDNHNYKIKFNILKRNLDFTKGSLVKMTNWTYRKIESNGLKIHVCPNCIKIYDNKRYLTDNPEEEDIKITKIIQDFAMQFAKDNDMEINPTPIPFGKDIKPLDFRVNENFRTKNFKSVYPTPCNPEWINPRTAPKDSVAFISHVDAIDNHLRQLDGGIDNLCILMNKQNEILEKFMVVKEESPTCKNVASGVVGHGNTSSKPPPKSIFQKIKELFK